jgi:RimJ/RimL family protein N-acetyltransferase
MAKIDKKIVKLIDGVLEIESPCVEDAKDIIKFIRLVDIETDYSIREADEFEFGCEDEEEFIRSKLESEYDVYLKAVYNGQIAGTLGFSVRTSRRFMHKGEFGMAILKEYWGLGIGKALMDTMIEWCEQIDIEKIILEVDVNNEKAIGLYKKYGFVQEGYLKNDKKMLDGTYRDSLVMAKMMK